jgi:type VI secretion system protein ImpC
MLDADDPDRPPLPKGWPAVARRAILHALSLSAAAFNLDLARWLENPMPEARERTEARRLRAEIDSFEFEEMSSPPDHDAYLWGNPGFHLALLLGRSFSDSGWEMQPGDINDLSDLPSHIHVEDGEKILKPCAEVLLSERAADAVIKLGLMPLLSYRDRNTVRVPRMQSIADPAAGLSGAWA